MTSSWVRRPVALASTRLILVLSFLWASPARAADPDPWFGTDKALHATVSGAVAASTYGIAAAAGVSARGNRLLLGGGVALGLGITKEIADAAGLGDPSWRDLTWDAIGTVLGLGIAWGVDLLVGGVSEKHPALVAPQLSTEVAPSGFVVHF